MISKVIIRKDHAMKRHPVHDSFSVQTQLALIAGWECLVAAAATARGKSKARLSQRRLPPTDVPPTTESNPTQRSVDNREACGGLVLMQPPCWGCDPRSDQAPVDEGRGEDVRRTNTWPAANASASWLVMTSWTGVSFLRESNPVHLSFLRVNYIRPKWTQG